MAASASRKKTFRSSISFARSIAMTIASGTRSTATNSTSGCALAVSQVKRPLPQPSSTYSAVADGISVRQWPRRLAGSAICQAAQACIRGIRFFFLLIRMAVSSWPGAGPGVVVFGYLTTSRRVCQRISRFFRAPGPTRSCLGAKKAVR